MKKLLEILSKLGILRYGASAGTYRNATEAPDDFEFMNMSGKKTKGDDETSEDVSQSGSVSSTMQHELITPIWVVVVTWVVGALFLLVAIGAFAERYSLVGFWMTLAGLVTIHHTNRLLALVGVDLSPLWRIIVILVCLVVSTFQL